MLVARLGIAGHLTAHHDHQPLAPRARTYLEGRGGRVLDILHGKQTWKDPVFQQSVLSRQFNAPGWISAPGTARPAGRRSDL